MDAHVKGATATALLCFGLLTACAGEASDSESSAVLPSDAASASASTASPTASASPSSPPEQPLSADRIVGMDPCDVFTVEAAAVLMGEPSPTRRDNSAAPYQEYCGYVVGTQPGSRVISYYRLDEDSTDSIRAEMELQGNTTDVAGIGEGAFYFTQNEVDCVLYVSVGTMTAAFGLFAESGAECDVDNMVAGAKIALSG